MLLLLILSAKLCGGAEDNLIPTSTGQFEGKLEDTWFVYAGDNRLVPWHSVSYKRRGALLDSMTPAVVAGCPLEPDPSVEYSCIDDNGIKPCGESEPHGAVARPRCRDPGYTSTAPFDDMRCSDGQWNYIAKCLPAPTQLPATPIPEAPPPGCKLETDSSIEYCCIDNNGTKPCGAFEPHGAVARPRCRDSDYTSTAPLEDMRCSDGQWNYIAKCSPDPTPTQAPAELPTTPIPEAPPPGCKLETDPSIEYYCIDDNGTKPCDTSEPYGAVARPRCRDPDYMSTVPLEDMRCNDGQWNYIAKCSPASTPATAVPPIPDTPIQVTPPGCRLEPDPLVDYFCIDDNGKRPCGASEPNGTEARPRCRDPVYTSTAPLKFMHCSDGQWNYVAKCSPARTPVPVQARSSPIEETAQPGCRLESDRSVDYNCIDGNTTKPCSVYEPHGAVVRPRCREPDYTSTAPLDDMRCSDGQWNYIAKCSPVCGKENFGPVIGNSWFVDEEKHGLVPWHTVIYQLTNVTVTNDTSLVLASLLPDLPNGTDTGQVMLPVCGGSLISSNIIISSQACFIDEWRQPHLFTAVAGKLNRPWLTEKNSDREEYYAQLAMVKNIHVPDVPESDIAVVVTENPFIFDRYVRPVCLNFEEQFNNHLVRPEANCRMVDWDGHQQRIVINLLSLGQRCENVSTFDEHEYKDLICALFPVAGAGCIDDSGGSGLAFRDENQQYFLFGVANVGPNPGFTCDSTGYFFFTHVTMYERFIKQYWTEPLTGNCILPPYPGHGTYNAYVSNGTHMRNIADARPGRSFELVTLNITCAPEHGLTGSSSISCLNGVWSEEFPKECVRMCRLDPHFSIEFRCIVSGTVRGTRACNLYEPPGTVVSPRCREPIYYSSTTIAFMRCINGHWNYLARCTPECGRVTPSGATLVVGGLPAKKGELPWHAGVYLKTTTPYMQICGGSLLSNSVIISAAHCFWKDLEKKLPESQFAVAVGKLYRPWNDQLDDAQKSDVAEIHIPPRFQGAGANFQEDIAVVIVASPFEYRTFIRPVCLSFDINFERLQLQSFNSGKVAGWGLTAADGGASPVLRVVEMPYVDVGTCLANSPPDFRSYITSDKICAGSLDSNISLCRGDSGGGLAFSELDKGLERYYLRGVVSAAPRDDAACNTRSYNTFTQIHAHETFIKQFLDL